MIFTWLLDFFSFLFAYLGQLTCCLSNYPLQKLHFYKSMSFSFRVVYKLYMSILLDFLCVSMAAPLIRFGRRVYFPQLPDFELHSVYRILQHSLWWLTAYHIMWRGLTPQLRGAKPLPFISNWVQKFYSYRRRILPTPHIPNSPTETSLKLFILCTSRKSGAPPYSCTPPSLWK